MLKKGEKTWEEIAVFDEKYMLELIKLILSSDNSLGEENLFLLIGIFSSSVVAIWKGKIIIALIENVSSIMKALIPQVGLIILVCMLKKQPDMVEDMEHIKKIKEISDEINGQQYEEKEAEESPPARAKMTRKKAASAGSAKNVKDNKI